VSKHLNVKLAAAFYPPLIAAEPSPVERSLRQGRSQRGNAYFVKRLVNRWIGDYDLVRKTGIDTLMSN
jgi:hypothetical protein